MMDTENSGRNFYTSILCFPWIAFSPEKNFTREILSAEFGPASVQRLMLLSGGHGAPGSGLVRNAQPNPVAALTLFQNRKR
jgi:hypothetical protein